MEELAKLKAVRTHADVDVDQELMQFFAYDHLPPPLRDASRPFCELANAINVGYGTSFSKTTALRKLLEAKDAAVRASMVDSRRR